MERTDAGAVYEELQPMGRTGGLEKIVEDGLLWEEPHAGAGEECEEGVAETTCDELTIPLRCLGGGGREFGSKVKPGKKRELDQILGNMIEMWVDRMDNITQPERRKLSALALLSLLPSLNSSQGDDHVTSRHREKSQTGLGDGQKLDSGSGVRNAQIRIKGRRTDRVLLRRQPLKEES
ncbi:importin-11 isoform x1 [Limosa lapponica baueri]|uniref:Importin-11 isoform x1 n=1 Tax=Limosa lapponica baueri TaxID=1758121 RepID=A0A2I0TW25_LIMLA|nr:importin-11 isoform x1 [Limosa lapponica baueri]